MAKRQRLPLLWDEIAVLLTSGSSPATILSYRLPRSLERRAQRLLAKSKRRRLTPDEERDLFQFDQAELFLRLVKARLRGRSSRDE
jgi:hypothetical protein